MFFARILREPTPKRMARIYIALKLGHVTVLWQFAEDVSQRFLCERWQRSAHVLYSSRNESFLTEQLNADTVHQQTWLQSVACFVDFSLKYFGLSHVFLFALLAHYEVGLSNKRLSIQFVFAVIDHSIFFLGEILNNFRWFFIEIGWKTDSLFSFIIQRASALWTSNMEDLR